MGKAKIIEHLGSSEYKVTYFYDMTEIDNKKIALAAEIIQLDVDILATETSITEALVKLEEYNTALDTLIDNYQTCLDTHDDEEDACSVEKTLVKAATVTYQLKVAEIADLNTKKDNLLFKLGRATKEELLYSGITGEEIIDIWCIDLCDRDILEPDFGLWLNHGEIIPVDTIVGTIEIFDFSTRVYNKYIVPASYTNNPAFDQSIHGLAGNVLANDGNAFVYNYNMRGPKYAWHPDFRLAIINSITELGIAQITYNNIKDLDGVKFNTEDHLHDSDITVDYMVCPTYTPFLAGDQVIITFEGDKMLNPKIIGYHKNPKACKGVLQIHHNPIYDQYGNGWGEPFYDPAEIDPPYGTAFAVNAIKTHNDRNKIANMREAGFEPLFGEQMTSFPGNNYFNGEWGVVGWWATGSVMNLNHTGWANSDCFNSVVGDIVRVWVGNTFPRAYDVEYWILTHNKDGTGYNASYEDDGKINFTAYFGYEEVFKHTSVFINGEEKTLTQGVTYGTNGVFISGCSLAYNAVTGFWLFYITSPISSIGNIGDETVWALKLDGDTYTNLGNIGVTYDPSDSTDYNKGKYNFSSDGTKFIGRRKNSNGLNTTIPDDWANDTMDMIRGTISFDAVTGLPSLAMNNSSLGNLGEFPRKNNGEFIVGFNGNDEVIYHMFPAGTGQGTPEFQIIFYDLQHDIIVGRYVEDNQPLNPSHDYIYVQIGGKLWQYPYDVVTGTYDFDTAAHVGVSIEGLVIDEVRDSYSNGSFIATEWGLMMSIGGYDLNEWMEIDPYFKNSNNVFIAMDGTVSHLSEEWLREPGDLPSVSPDPLLRVRPLGMSRKSTN